MIRGKTKLAERFNWLFPHRARSVVVIELSDIATRLKELFDRVPPKKRGRSAIDRPNRKSVLNLKPM